MTDVFSKTKRSEVMSRIRSRGNKDTELRLIQLFRRFQIVGWRRHEKLVGRPDFVFRSARVAVFVDGCFWHGCPRCYRRPHSNQTYWDAKVLRNRQRDRETDRLLRKLGWRVLRIWEHDLASRKDARLLHRIRRALGPATGGASRRTRTAGATPHRLRPR
jgi:DNA mismatch endonuclease (patch repair protein)